MKHIGVFTERDMWDRTSRLGFFLLMYKNVSYYIIFEDFNKVQNKIIEIATQL